MYKVKDNTFRIQDFTKKDNIDESRFVEGKSQRGKPQLQAQVCVLFPDEYTSLNQDIAPLKEELEHLKSIIKDKDSQIETLEAQANEKEDIDVDEVQQLRQEKSNKEKELDTLKKTHAKQVLDIYRKHNKETNELKDQYETKLDEINDKLLSEVQANKQASDKLKDEIASLHQEKSTLEKTYLEDLKTLESEHANEILDITKAHHDEVMHLKEETSQIKEDHQKDLREIDKDHSDEVEHIRTTFLKLVTNENTQDINEINAIAGDVPSILKPFLRKHLTKLEDMKERKQSHEPERIINTYELSGKKEKE